MVRDLDPFLNQPTRNRVKFVGIELEGGWPAIPNDSLSQFHRDGSVRIEETRQIQVVGEVVSPPMAPVGIASWVKAHYPKAMNTTCGLHIHQSFYHDRHYHRLMVKDYQDTLIAALGAWARGKGLPDGHPIWKRLRGEERYCSLGFWPDVQAAKNSHGDQASPERFFQHGSRYTAVNYCYSLGGRGTMEVRVLPMFPEGPDVASEALCLIVKVTNACLMAFNESWKVQPTEAVLGDMDLNTEIVEEDYSTL